MSAKFIAFIYRWYHGPTVFSGVSTVDWTCRVPTFGVSVPDHCLTTHPMWCLANNCSQCRYEQLYVSYSQRHAEQTPTSRYICFVTSPTASFRWNPKSIGNKNEPCDSLFVPLRQVDGHVELRNLHLYIQEGSLHARRELCAKVGGHHFRLITGKWAHM